MTHPPSPVGKQVRPSTAEGFRFVQDACLTSQPGGNPCIPKAAGDGLNAQLNHADQGRTAIRNFPADGWQESNRAERGDLRVRILAERNSGIPGPRENGRRMRHLTLRPYSHKGNAQPFDGFKTARDAINWNRDCLDGQIEREQQQSPRDAGEDSGWQRACEAHRRDHWGASMLVNRRNHPNPIFCPDQRRFVQQDALARNCDQHRARQTEPLCPTARSSCPCS